MSKKPNQNPKPAVVNYKLGDFVRFRLLNEVVVGKIVELRPAKKEVIVTRNDIKIPVAMAKILGNDDKPLDWKLEDIVAKQVSVSLAPSIGDCDAEIDLHGYDLSEALAKLDAAIVQAHQAAARNLRVVHGKGEGILRNSVNSALRAHIYVAGFQQCGPNQGGEGATLVEIRGRRAKF